MEPRLGHAELTGRPQTGASKDTKLQIEVSHRTAGDDPCLVAIGSPTYRGGPRINIGLRERKHGKNRHDTIRNLQARPAYDVVAWGRLPEEQPPGRSGERRKD